MDDVRAQDVDASRRTRLAGERTMLAWLRTALTALAVGLAAGKIVPELTSGPRWPYAVVGGGFCVLGIALVLFGLYRGRQVERALDRGEYVRVDDRVGAALAAFLTLLALGTIAIVVYQS